MRYLMSDVTGFTIHTENGGCGQPHTIVADENGVRTIDCPACETAMRQGHGYGHATTPGAVLATPDEIAEQERVDAAANKAGMRRLAELSAGVAGQVPTDFLAQMQAMQATMLAQQAQIAELTAKLAGPAAIESAEVPVKATPVKATKSAGK